MVAECPMKEFSHNLYVVIHTMAANFFDEDDFVLSMSTQGGIPLCDTQLCIDLCPPSPLDTIGDSLCDSQVLLHVVNTRTRSPLVLASASPEVVRDVKTNFEAVVSDVKDNNFDSELLQQLIDKECTVDDLLCNPRSEKTYNSTFTAIRSFNRFWATHHFNSTTESSVLSLKMKYAGSSDGFHALCLAGHTERNIMLCHFIAKVNPFNQSKKKILTGGAKRIYLLGIQRALKLYEKQHNLVHIYGRDWCFSSDVEYEQLESVLDNKTAENEFDNVQDFSSEIMSLQQFQALHERTWELANDMSLSFAERLQHKQRFLMQGTVAFGCLRAREDLAECRTDEFTILSAQTIEFQMKRKFKSHKITKTKKVVQKPARYIYGERYVLVLRELLQNRPDFHTQVPETTSDAQTNKQKAKPDKQKKQHKKKITTPTELRLWLKVLPRCSQTDTEYFTKAPMGEKQVAKAVSTYIPDLLLKNPLFDDATKKFTNSSLRKYHNDMLSESGAPIIVQQESLAQNTKAYARKATHPTHKQKVARIVAGERKTWHSPTKRSPPSFHVRPQSSLPLKKRKHLLPFNDNTPDGNDKQSLVFSNSGNAFKVHFTNGTSSFSFEGNL